MTSVAPSTFTVCRLPVSSLVRTLRDLLGTLFLGSFATSMTDSQTTETGTPESPHVSTPPPKLQSTSQRPAGSLDTLTPEKPANPLNTGEWISSMSSRSSDTASIVTDVTFIVSDLCAEGEEDGHDCHGDDGDESDSDQAYQQCHYCGRAASLQCCKRKMMEDTHIPELDDMQIDLGSCESDVDAAEKTHDSESKSLGLVHWSSSDSEQPSVALTEPPQKMRKLE